MNATNTEGFFSEQIPSEGLKGIAEQAIAAGRDIQNSAHNLAEASAMALKDHASELVDSAKEIASQAGDRLQETVAEKKGMGADYVGHIAQTMRRAAGEFDVDAPLAASYIRLAADHVTDAADALRDGNLSNLIQRAQSFARSQPTAFLGIAVLAGFGAVRFLKSASSGADGSKSLNPDLQGGDNHDGRLASQQ